jgi:hypothetical protein
MVAAGTAASGCRPARTSPWRAPVLMAALVLGVLGTMLFWQLFTHIGIDPYLGPRVLVYPGLVILISLVVWLSVFRG